MIAVKLPLKPHGEIKALEAKRFGTCQLAASKAEPWD